MHPVTIADEHRVTYHAAAVIASNHLVALLGQVERLANAASVPFEAFQPLARASLDNAFAVGPRVALTGPVARGDVETVSRHLAGLPPEEQPAYRAMAQAASRLTERDDEAMRAVLA
jgi:predicted short-subunit dehydrogenase-like oxidoreductase (DUF2520 family)